MNINNVNRSEKKLNKKENRSPSIIELTTSDDSVNPQKNNSLMFSDEKYNLSLIDIIKLGDKTDYISTFFAIIGSIIVGVIMSIYFIIIGEVCNDIGNIENFGNITDNNVIDIKDSIKENISDRSKIIIVLGCVQAIISFISLSLWVYTLKKQRLSIHSKYFDSIMNEDMSWFDKLGFVEFENENFDNKKVGRNIATTIESITQFVFGFIYGFSRSWELSLITLGLCIPSLIISAYIIFIVIKISKDV